MDKERLEETIKHIVKLRSKLNEALKDKNISEKELLNLSQQLDEIINKYYLIKKLLIA